MCQRPLAEVWMHRQGCRAFARRGPNGVVLCPVTTSETGPGSPGATSIVTWDRATRLDWALA